MKSFKRIDPTIVQVVGNKFKNKIIVKTFEDSDGNIHEFTTWRDENLKSCAVIAITPEGKVITTYEFRPGPESWMYELPGGGIEQGEQISKAAVRELAEETGYQPGELIKLGVVCRDAYVNGEWHYFLATNCKILPSGRKLDELEELQGAEVRLISIDELIDNAKKGRMTDPLAVFMAYDELLKNKGDAK